MVNSPKKNRLWDHIIKPSESFGGIRHDGPHGLLEGKMRALAVDAVISNREFFVFNAEDGQVSVKAERVPEFETVVKDWLTSRGFQLVGTYVDTSIIYATYYSDRSVFMKSVDTHESATELKYFVIKLFTSDEDLFKSFMLDIFGKFHHRDDGDSEGKAFVLTQDPYSHGLKLRKAGFAAHELERGNYSSAVLTAFDKSVRDLMSESPSGRLTILDGPPGTGKTYMVRAFMDAAPDSKFIIVPPQFVKDLASPKMISTLIDESLKKIPLVLVLEDADQCLSTRHAENISSISSVLNLSDGIIGSMLDIRLITTTNTSASEFDAAVMRAGRLSAHICVGALSAHEARLAWYRISETLEPPIEMLKKMDAGNATIAEIYSAAAAVKTKGE